MDGIHSRDFILNKLAYIRYILNLSKEQCSLSEPLGSVGLLIMHDAVEMTLQLSAVHLSLAIPQDLMGYWKLFAEMPDAFELSNKGAVNRISKARTSLKHYGTFPSKSELLEFVVLAEAFIDETVIKVFDIELQSVSLSSMVEYEPVRIHLQNAEKYMKEFPGKALEEIAIAFTIFIQYFRSIHSSYGRSIFPTTSRLNASLRVGSLTDKMLESQRKSIEALDEVVEILMLGIDYIQYSRYKLCIPKITSLASGKLHVQTWRIDQPTIESSEFAQRFVLEQILRLQQKSFETRVANANLIIASHAVKENSALDIDPSYQVDGFWLHQNGNKSENLD